MIPNQKKNWKNGKIIMYNKQPSQTYNQFGGTVTIPYLCPDFSFTRRMNPIPKAVEIETKFRKYLHETYPEEEQKYPFFFCDKIQKCFFDLRRNKGS
jgi:hypothetical protein